MADHETFTCEETFFWTDGSAHDVEIVYNEDGTIEVYGYCDFEIAEAIIVEISSQNPDVPLENITYERYW